MTAKRSFERRASAIPSPQKLANAATFYLSRYAASEDSLRRVLKNKLRRAAMTNAAFAADRDAQRALLEEIERIIETHKKSGVLNDAAFADMKVASLRRAGKSARRIGQTLAQKGIRPDIVAAALAPEDEESAQDAERRAALAFARKKRLGPFAQHAAPSAKASAKAFASLARAGFSVDVIKGVLNDPIDEPGALFDSFLDEKP